MDGRPLPEYVAKMENVLAVYERPLQANRARLCFERYAVAGTALSITG